MEGCKDLVVNMSRHMRLCHPDIVEEKDVITKGRVYDRTIVKGSPVIPIETKEMAFLDKCLSDFK